MFRNITVFLLMFALLTLPLSAQTDQAKRDKRAAEVKAKIGKIGTGEKARVKVRLYDNTRYEGYLRQVSDTGFVVVTKEGNSHDVNFTDVRSLGGRNLSTGAKIGIGIAIGAGVTVLAILLIIANLDE